jgi:alpha-L-fucosidase 2
LNQGAQNGFLDAFMIHKLLAGGFLALSICLLTSQPGLAAADSDLTLWYLQPAADNHPMEEALPIGNGRMGALIFGAPERERINVNESSLWTGGDNPSGDYGTMGAYQVLGNAYIALAGQTNATEYARELNLANALSRVSYRAGGVKFEREFFCSQPAQVLVARFTASRRGAYTGSIQLADAHNARVTADGNRITVAGSLDNGMKFEWQLLALAQGGTLAAVPSANPTRLEFSGCDSLTILIGAHTDYVFDCAKQYHGANPHARVSAELDAAARKSFAKLRGEHIKDYQALFNRVTADFGKSRDAQTVLPTDLRKLEGFRVADPGLAALQFQYGRYLLISCSRPGGLPANLQGLWNDTNDPPWHGDYHMNINIQMNYWPVEVANLAECHLPLFDLVTSQLPAWRQATALAPEFKTADGNFARRGFAIRTSHNITGGMGWRWDNTANAWYCQHFWEHFAFGRDQEYLRTVAYPVMKETCEFWQDHLKALPDGKLVVPNAWSPEHGPEEDGVNYSQEIVWDLFNNYVQAADTLRIDQDYRDQIAALRDRLAAPGIGSWGQLLEWMHEQHNPKFPELDTPNDHHRHTSHLFAVYPGRQISVTKTPALAAAAKVLLDARGIDAGSDVREWSFAWRVALYARLHDPENAYNMLRQFFAARNSSPNLFGLHPPVQLDGNFGVTAGIAELLLQSQAGEIELLPALPQEWPAGKISGLRARGGYEIGITWRDGKLASATIKNFAGDSQCQVRCGGRVVALTVPRGKTKELNAELR